MSNWLLDVDGNFLPETGEELGIRKCSHGKITVSTIGLEGYYGPYIISFKTAIITKCCRILQATLPEF